MASDDSEIMNKIAEYSERYNSLALNVIRYFSGDLYDNVVFSPFSIVMLLSVAADSVDGKTRQEIMDVIGVDMPYEEYLDMIAMLQNIWADESGALTSSNAVCIQEKIKDSVTADYEKRLAKLGGKLFASRDIVSDVNNWVKEKTRGMIENVADESMREMLACMMNAIAFEADWAKKYDEDDIHPDKFKNSDGSKSDVMMLDSVERGYIEDENFTGFVKPYKGSEYSYMALLPKKKGRASTKCILKALDFTKIYKSYSDTEVYVTMPEFKYDFGEEITNLCKDMGIKTLFTSSADFSPMSSMQLKMDAIVHKAHIEVDRKGTKAAAVTMAFVCAGCIPEEEENKEVRLDRPFVYAIVHNKTGLPVFVGIVNRIESVKGETF